jgi:hypothetical protein
MQVVVQLPYAQHVVQIVMLPSLLIMVLVVQAIAAVAIRARIVPAIYFFMLLLLVLHDYV